MSLSQRSHSAAPSDAYHCGYYRSSSPRRGSLSPPEYRGHDIGSIPPYSGGTSIITPYDSGLGSSSSQQQRFQSRSATATPTGSPKKRQLPKVNNLTWAFYGFKTCSNSIRKIFLRI